MIRFLPTALTAVLFIPVLALAQGDCDPQNPNPNPNGQPVQPQDPNAIPDPNQPLGPSIEGGAPGLDIDLGKLLERQLEGWQPDPGIFDFPIGDIPIVLDDKSLALSRAAVEEGSGNWEGAARAYEEGGSYDKAAECWEKRAKELEAQGKTEDAAKARKNADFDRKLANGDPDAKKKLDEARAHAEVEEIIRKAKEDLAREIEERRQALLKKSPIDHLTPEDQKLARDALRGALVTEDQIGSGPEALEYTAGLLKIRADGARWLADQARKRADEHRVKADEYKGKADDLMKDGQKAFDSGNELGFRVAGYIGRLADEYRGLELTHRQLAKDCEEEAKKYDEEARKYDEAQKRAEEKAKELRAQSPPKPK